MIREGKLFYTYYKNYIRFLYERDIELKVSVQQFDTIERYLLTGIPILKNNVVDAMIVGVRNRWKQTGDYYTIVSGVSSTVLLLKQLHDLGTSLALEPLPSGIAPTGSEGGDYS